MTQLHRYLLGAARDFLFSGRRRAARFVRLSLPLALGLVLASSIWAGKPNPADGTGRDSDHIPIQMKVRETVPCADGYICSDVDEPYVHEVDNVLCELNSPGSVICNSSDSKKRVAERWIWFVGPALAANGISSKVPLRMTTTFCNVRDLGAGESTDCNLNFRIDLGGDLIYSLRFDANEGSTQVKARCTDSPLDLLPGEQCQTFKLTTEGVENPAAALYRPGRRDLEWIDTVALEFEFSVQIIP